jgi:DNA polymerase-3 subunit epsilon
MDLRVFTLPVLSANEQELAAHEVVLKQIDKDSKGKTVWRAPELVAAG